jgi:DNA processing protein
MPSADQGAGRNRDEVSILSLDDERYPPLLKLIDDPPARLYVCGDPALLSFPQVAMVGSRRASAGGLRAAVELAGALSAAGLVICSGLALGIDGASHRGALEAGGRTTAVLGTGIDRIYPSRHRRLAEALVDSGCLVSEFPPGTPPRRHHFPRRNRIISGLSLGVVVVEAALPSGSLITAGTALEQGREVFALPWSMLHRGGRGCLQLLRDGAKLVRDVDDVLEELWPVAALLRDQSPAGEPRSAGPSKLLEMVGFEPTGPDELMDALGLSAAEMNTQLTMLEMEGLVRRCPGGYIRC